MTYTTRLIFRTVFLNNLTFTIDIRLCYRMIDGNALVSKVYGTPFKSNHFLMSQAIKRP